VRTTTSLQLLYMPMTPESHSSKPIAAHNGMAHNGNGNGNDKGVDIDEAGPPRIWEARVHFRLASAEAAMVLPAETRVDVDEILVRKAAS
jgi:hypothetical protein